MKARILISALVVAALATAGLVGPTQTPSRADGSQKTPVASPAGVVVRPAPVGGWHPFNAVYEIMNREPAQKGCVGCHINPAPAVGFWFGADRQSVLRTLETGVNPLGDDMGLIPVEGGRDSVMAVMLHFGIMPLGGEPWDDADLALLDFWLRMYE